MQLPIYLDNNATTRVDPEVLETMLPYFSETFGNASSKTHSFGWNANEAVSNARTHAASLIGAKPREIYFTGGATEANNLALLGATTRIAPKGGHVITSRVEHDAVLDPCRVLEQRGFSVTRLAPDPTGRITPDQVAGALQDDTVLVSLMTANNETGTLNPIAEISQVTRPRGILFHTDCAQGVGKVPIDVDSLGVDLLSTSGHKFYGPKGVGYLYVRSRNPKVSLDPIVFGGGQEHGLRPGTLNVPLIVGIGAASKRAGELLASETAELRRLSLVLLAGLQSELDGVEQNGHPEERLSGTVNVAFQSIESEALLLALQEVAISSGSACTAESVEPSHVLLGMGLPRERAHSSVRFSIGRFNTEEEVRYAIDQVVGTVRQLRG